MTDSLPMNNLNMDDEDFDGGEEKITDPAKFGAHEVQEEAFQRYIERLENDAVEENEVS